MSAEKKKGETKRQHYVPRFVLRNFSEDEANIGVLILGSGKIVPSGPIKTQAYGDYFYGADQILEKAFAEGEGDISRRLGDLSDERLNNLSAEDLVQVKFFVHYQLARTQAAVEQMDSMATAMTQRVIRQMSESNGEPIPEGVLQSIKASHADGPTHAMMTATKSLPVIHDLNVRFLRTQHRQKLVIGDHPVVLHNQFAEHHPVLQGWGRATGLAAKGLQMFMPVSPDICIMIFDAATYNLDGSQLVCNIGPKDVDAMNQCRP